MNIKRILTLVITLSTMVIAFASNVNDEEIEVTSITFDPKSITLLAGESIQLTPIILPENATSPELKWESANSTIATVDANGMVTTLSPGKCTIRARYAKKTSTYGYCTLTVKAAEPKAGAVVINEIQAANLDMFLDPSFNYGSWIELFNTTNVAVNIGGALYVSDNASDLKKHLLMPEIGHIAPNGFLTLWFDHFGVWNKGEHNQIPFKLDYDGGTIILSDGENIIAQQTYPQAIARTSYARTTDGGNEWGITGNPTPNASNAASIFSGQSQLPAPVVDKDAQLFTGNLQVCVNIPDGATLRYTTDGSTPTLTNGKTSETGVFTVSETTPYRFRLFKDGMLPSAVVTRTYIYNDKDFTLPIISIVGSKDDLFGTDHGVFVQGSGNGRPGAGQANKCNWNMDWDRPVNFEFIGNEEEGGEYRMLFNQEVDLSRCGGWSRAWTPYSFKLKAAKYYYGQNALNYTFFPGKPYIKNKTLQIRNGGNDNNCRIKDAALQEIISRSGVYVDGQQYMPVMHFINGEYRGVINMREPNNKHFAYANYGIDTDEMDQFEISPDSGYIQMVGTKEAFNQLYELAKDAANEDTYNEIAKLLDIDEYLNYMAIQLYLGGDDWPKNNVKGFRDVTDGRFHFVIFDLDHAFNQNHGANNKTNAFTGFKNKQNWTFDGLYGQYWDGTAVKGNTTGSDGKSHWRKEIEFVTIFLNLLKNENFKKAFADRFCVISGSVFSPKRCSDIVNELAQRVEGPMQYIHATSPTWGGWWGPSEPQPDSPWSTANSVISELTQDRIANMTKAMATFVNYKQNDRMEAYVSTNVSNAEITVNDFAIPTGTMNGYLYSPITLTAKPLAGYKFAGWSTGRNETSYATTTLLTTGSKWNYYDSGSLDGKTWKTGTLSGWRTGSSPLGYGKNTIATTTASNKPTYYFRTSVTLDNTPTDDTLFGLEYTIDDGFIIYINGKEAARYNMPTGNVTYNTFATTYANNNPDYGNIQLSASLFKQGNNDIAVEVHNNSTSSTDIMWDATLTMLTPIASGVDIITTEAEYEVPFAQQFALTAIYEPLTADEIAAEGIKPVMINEISAANSIYINDYFKKNDWIELYNTTDNDINIAGMYVSDKEENPELYQVPTDNVLLNTIIPAHGYKVLWADKLDNIGADIHTSFKLAAEGGTVTITTDKYSDALTYTAHTSNQTFGRYPDGASEAFVMNIPTIGKANKTGLIDTVSAIDPSQPDAIPSLSREGGITIAYFDNVINAKSEDSPIVALHVYASSGIKVNVPTVLRSGDTFATANLASQPKGIYIARVLTADGNECHIKVMVK